MKVTLEFDTEEEGQRAELEEVMQASRMGIALWDMQQYLRSQYKYADEPDDIEKIYEMFFEILGDNNVNLE